MENVIDLNLAVGLIFIAFSLGVVLTLIVPNAIDRWIDKRKNK